MCVCVCVCVVYRNKTTALFFWPTLSVSNMARSVAAVAAVHTWRTVGSVCMQCTCLWADTWKAGRVEWWLGSKEVGQRMEIRLEAETSLQSSLLGLGLCCWQFPTSLLIKWSLHRLWQRWLAEIVHGLIIVYIASEWIYQCNYTWEVRFICIFK